MKCLSDLDSHLTWSLFCLERRWFFERVSRLASNSLYVAEDLEPPDPHSYSSWDYRHAPPCPALVV